MECTVHWTKHSDARSEVGFIAQTGSGHSIAMDGAVEAGGANLGARPMEMLLAGAGGCSAYDVVLILQRGRQAIQQCSVRVQADRAPVDPKIFTKIHLHFTLQGDKLSPAAVKRAIALSHEKYCSATIMLGACAEVSTSYEIVQLASD